jgi:hypothetical protein
MKAEAIFQLAEYAKNYLWVIDGEYGCCHSYEEMLANMADAELGDGPKPIQCPMHDEAVEVSRIILAASV